ncbi:MAG: hypothetical protein ABF379_04965 [Akkermansiaceae bacterium]
MVDHGHLPGQPSRPINEVPPLNDSIYRPRGSTTLLDALGQTINDLGQGTRDTPKEEHPGQVIVAIFTDGGKNSSMGFSMQEINRLITQQQDVYS